MLKLVSQLLKRIPPYSHISVQLASSGNFSRRSSSAMQRQLTIVNEALISLLKLQFPSTVRPGSIDVFTYHGLILLGTLRAASQSPLYLMDTLLCPREIPFTSDFVPFYAIPLLTSSRSIRNTVTVV